MKSHIHTLAPIAIPGTDVLIGGDEVFVIAEIGKNFIETEEEQEVPVYIENAKKLIDAAVEAGCDAVKFQTHVVEDEQLDIKVVSPHFKGADRYSWISRNERSTPPAFWQAVAAHAKEKGIIFFSTPMSRGAAEKLMQVDPPLWKVASGDIFDYVLMDTLIKTGKPIIISTGMTSLLELDGLVADLTSRGAKLVILYCVSQYPCPHEAFNLASIELFREKYPEIPIGFSDHSVDGHEVDLAAIKVGARIIEKHFSFSRELWGADHKSSITPAEMKAMVDAIRAKEYEWVDTTSFYGAKERELEGAESQFRPYFNKSLVAGRDLPAGTVLERDMVYAMRPRMYAGPTGSERLHEVLGKRLVAPLKKFEPLTLENLA